MKLSFTAILVYVLHSGCVGRLNMGHIERDGKGGVNVFGPERTINEYISGTNLRSWCVVGWTAVQSLAGARCSPKTVH